MTAAEASTCVEMEETLACHFHVLWWLDKVLFFWGGVRVVQLYSAIKTP